MSQTALPDRIGRYRPASTPRREESTLTGAQVLAADRERILRNITEITNTLVGEYRISEIIDMALETVYCGMGFDRVLFCLRDPCSRTVAARLVLWEDTGRVVAGFRFTPEEGGDLFSDALRRHKD